MDAYELGSWKKIKSNDRYGQIVAILIDLNGRKFLTQYADDDGELHEVWLYASQFDLAATS